jgi:hypothetical protein
MLKSLRAALAPAGGLSALVALGAIAWGLGRLQSLADERSAQLDQIDEAAADVEEALAQLRLAPAARHLRHPRPRPRTRPPPPKETAP